MNSMPTPKGEGGHLPTLHLLLNLCLSQPFLQLQRSELVFHFLRHPSFLDHPKTLLFFALLEEHCGSELLLEWQ